MIARRKFRTRAARKRQHHRFVLKVTVLVLLGVLAVALVFYGLRYEGLRIQEVTVETDGSLDTAAIGARVQESLDGSIIGLFPKSSILFLHTTEIERMLHTNFPRIREVDIQRKSFHTLHAVIKERLPAALWCGDVVPTVPKPTTASTTHSEAGTGRCYLVDNEAYIYAVAPTFSGESFPRYYGSLSQAEPAGQHMIPVAEFQAWQAFHADMQEHERPLAALLFVDERDVEIYLTNGLRIFIPRTLNKQESLQRLLTTLDSDAIDTTRAIDYLDLRFGTKVFIKYQLETSTD